MRSEERMTVQGPVKKQQPDGMSHRGGGAREGDVRCWRGRKYPVAILWRRIESGRVSVCPCVRVSVCPTVQTRGGGGGLRVQRHINGRMGPSSSTDPSTPAVPMYNSRPGGGWARGLTPCAPPLRFPKPPVTASQDRGMTICSHIGLQKRRTLAHGTEVMKAVG